MKFCDYEKLKGSLERLELEELLKTLSSDLMWLTCPPQGQKRGCVEEIKEIKHWIKDVKKEIRKR